MGSQDGVGGDRGRLLAVLATTRAFAELAHDHGGLVAAIGARLASELGATCDVQLAAEAAGPIVAPAGALVVALSAHGRTLGHVSLARAAPFDAADRELAQILTDHAALALATARAYVELRAERDTARAAYTAARPDASRFARLVQSGVLGVLVSTVGRRVVAVNEALAQMLGYTREELLAPGLVWMNLTPADWVERDNVAVDALRRSGISRLREKEYFHKDGHRVAVMVGSAMVEDDSGECISFVLDITDRKRIEAEAHRLREERAANARLAAIVDSSDDAIMGFDLQGVVTSWNPGARKMFGYADTEIVGQSLARLVPAERASEPAGVSARVVAGDVVHLDTVRRHKDGHDIDVAVTISPIFDEAREVVGVSTVARDITARRRAELALAQAKDSAEAATRELETFSYSVAHDLRAPLRAINSFVQLLLDDHGDRLDAEARACIDEIRGGADKMGGLIDALLSLSRLTRSELRPHPTDLAALVRTAAAELAAADPERRVDVIAPDVLEVVLDPRLARAMVQNLVGNAWKFTSRAVAARIELGAIERDGGPVYFIRDNGAGFDMAHATKLFAPFQRMHTVREFTGTGIGLATVQRIVRRHGGQIWAEARVNEGATFFFTFADPSLLDEPRPEPQVS